MKIVKTNDVIASSKKPSHPRDGSNANVTEPSATVTGTYDRLPINLPTDTRLIFEL